MIYFDVTRLLEWQGSYTGMERVAYELALNMTNEKNTQTTRLIYFTETTGFVDVTDEVTWSNGRLASRITHEGSIRQMARTHPIKAAKEYLRRSYHDKILEKCPKITPGQDSVLFISDGLWDRTSYIDEVVKTARMGVKIGHLVHDMVPLVVPHACHDFVTKAIKEYFTIIAPYIDVLVSISKNTENDFFTYFGEYTKTTLERVIIRHGEDFTEGEDSKPAIVDSLTDFVLCVGTLEIRKNHILLYQSYKLAAERGIELPPLVIVGREGWLTEQTMKLIRDDPEVKDKIFLAGPVSDAELAWLYKHCSFTTLAALYEGWGLQVAESLYYGKVCAVSSAGPLPEVGGDLNVYFSPYNTQECLDALQRLTDKATRKAMESRIKKEYKPTTWRDAAKTITSAL
jgi:glycosyltransferase involved in cell wall biosynthesis